MYFWHSILRFVSMQIILWYIWTIIPSGITSEREFVGAYGRAWSLAWACTPASEQFQSLSKYGTKMFTLFFLFFFFFFFLPTTTKNWIFCLCQFVILDYAMNFIWIFIAVWPCSVKLSCYPYTLNRWYCNHDGHRVL